MYKLDTDLKYTWKNRGYPRQTHLEDRSCDHTKKSLSIDHKGRVFHCRCDGWLPFNNGTILDFGSVEEIFSSKMARKLQQSTDTGGSFKFCNTQACGIRNNSWWTPAGHMRRNFIVAVDDSCNLQCASCRENLIFFKSGPVYEYRQRLMRHFKTLLEADARPSRTTIGGNGDAFASVIYKEFLYSLDLRDDQVLILKTNGILIEREIEKFNFINNIASLDISIDAGTESTYGVLRAPGKWHRLIDNIKFSRQLGININLNFVIQKRNLYDIEPFLKLCEELDCVPNLTMVEDWGTWHNFHEHDVTDERNPCYSDWVKIKEEFKL